MSRKIQIVLPGPIADQLQELAATTQEPQATLAALLVRNGLAQAANDGKVRPLKQTPPTTTNSSNNGGRAPWLEPYGGSKTWRQQTWGAIVALHGRYPQALAHLKDQWWTNDQHTETLSALAIWRTEIDDNSQDPRDELAFQTQLNDYTHTLQQQNTGTTNTWTPGAPPDDW